MPTSVRFVYLTGIKREIFRDPRLVGSWDTQGHYSDQWMTVPMQTTRGPDGCPIFDVIVQLDPPQEGTDYRWGVLLDGPAANSIWGIMDKVRDINSDEHHRSFRLQAGDPAREERYYLTHCRRLGAQKHYRPGQDHPGIRFAVWAPNAKKVELVFGEFVPGDRKRQTGYIANDGTGVDAAVGPFTLRKPDTKPWDGAWETDPDEPALADFRRFDHRPYMFRITKDDGSVAYRTDLYSRCQIGKGRIDPNGQPYSGHYTDLDGSKGCSVVIDPDTVCKQFQEQVWPEIEFVPAEEFWKNELDHSRPLPQRVEDLVIYELHVGSLGYGKVDQDGKPQPGDFGDVLSFLDYLVDLGVNAVELMPVMEFEGIDQWGYGTSHYCALEFSAGGRDQLKHLVRACHRRGIAVILDVVYNHYHHRAERAEWMYDSNAHQRNIYYWYEGRASDYPQHPQGEGGYVDNMSTGYAPRYYEEMVRKLFISSAVALVEEFHIDGFRVDQTTSIHSYNRLHADGREVSSANIFGAEFLRQLCRTLKTIRPQVVLIAEDHSDWDKVTQPPDQDGLGFDAAWYAAFYHHLVGDAMRGPQDARLIKIAGFGNDEALAIDYFAGALGWSRQKKVLYSESHDEAGNAEGTHRTMVVAANGAPLVADTRRCAEARSRWAFAMAMLSAGTPMFLMGEEIGATKDFRYKDTTADREDLWGERYENGARLFEYYSDLIKLRLRHSAIRSHAIDILHAHNVNRVLAFYRENGTEQFLAVASLNNQPFASGYVVRHPRIVQGRWKEVFNSDAAHYGGSNVGNQGATLLPQDGGLNVVLPANGVVIFRRV